MITDVIIINVSKFFNWIEILKEQFNYSIYLSDRIFNILNLYNMMPDCNIKLLKLLVNLIRDYLLE